MVCRWLSGRQLYSRDAVYRSVRNGKSSGRNSLSTLVGSGSNEHNFDGALMMVDLTSSAGTGSKASRIAVAGGPGNTSAGRLVDSGDLLVEEVEKLLCR
jgi:hypothetical protein